jgi:hypothetical protein
MKRYWRSLASRTGSPITKIMLLPQGEANFVRAAAGSAVITNTTTGRFVI